MKLKDCTYGILVEDEEGSIGMIVGITNNCPHSDMYEKGLPEKAIPLVQWASGATYGIHYGNIKPFKGF